MDAFLAYGGKGSRRWHLRWTRGSWYAPKESQVAMGFRVVLGRYLNGWRGKPLVDL